MLSARLGHILFKCTPPHIHSSLLHPHRHCFPSHHFDLLNKTWGISCEIVCACHTLIVLECLRQTWNVFSVFKCEWVSECVRLWVWVWVWVWVCLCLCECVCVSVLISWTKSRIASLLDPVHAVANRYQRRWGCEPYSIDLANLLWHIQSTLLEYSSVRSGGSRAPFTSATGNSDWGYLM